MVHLSDKVLALCVRRGGGGVGVMAWEKEGSRQKYKSFKNFVENVFFAEEINCASSRVTISSELSCGTKYRFFTLDS
jgi:hypothetical protein